MKALIAAGGKGTRLRPITTTQNKHEIPLANVSMIERAVEKVVEAGITEIFISINEGETSIQSILGDGKKKGVSITYIEQIGGALGVAHVLGNARDYLQGDDVLFYLGDNIIFGEIKPFLDQFYAHKHNCLLALARVDNPQRFGVPVIDNGQITEIQEKPQNPPSPYAVAGIYVYDQHIFDVLDELEVSDRGEFEISDAHTQLIQSGYSVGYEEITGWWKDTGKPEDLLEGNGLILSRITSDIQGTIEKDVSLQGAVHIAPGVQITGKSVIRGPVVIGENTHIHNAYIGPYTSIGKECYLTEVEVEQSIIMNQSHIDVDTRIVDSLIGHKARITNRTHTFPKGHHVILGDNSHVEL